MGSWRNRPRFFHRRRTWKSPPPYSYDEEPPSSGYNEDGVPLWEKKFCSIIGALPWQKIVNAKKFMFSSSVLDWDDSAGKEAFDNAKNRFWAQINGLPCDISLPDPDVYIDEIDWNPDLDPELMKDLDSVYFAPDEGQNDGMVWRGRKKNRYFKNANIGCNSGERRPNMEPSNVLVDKALDTTHRVTKNENNDDNLWDPGFTLVKEDLNCKVQQGWGQWDNENERKKMNNDYNPWECNTSQGKDPVTESTWGNSGKQDNVDNPWEQSCHTVDYVKDGKRKGWDGSGDNSWGWTQHKSWNLDSSENPFPRGSFTHYGGPHRDRGQRDCGGDQWGWKGRDNYSGEPKCMEYGRSNGEGRNWSKSCRKREGSHLIGYRSSGYQPDNRQTGHCWRRRSSNKRVSFVQ